jgi:hypothetical protein
VTTVGAAPTTDFFWPFRGAAPYVRIHTNASGLAALGRLHCQLGWRIELFHSSRRTPLCILELIKSQCSFEELQTCDDACVQWLSPPFELRNATHRLPFTCRLLDGVSRQRPCLHTSATSRSAPSPLPTRLGRMTLPSAMLVRRLVYREVGTTRYSPAADVPRFRASEPPFFPRYLHCHDDHGLGP